MSKTATGGLRRSHIAAVVAGNGLEFYDFLTFSFFAAQIGRTFFPGQKPGDSLLMALATFGAGFLTRPLGALVIGRMGDRLGRKPAMQLTFILMGVAGLGIALTPPTAWIGPAAPLLLLLFRLTQGFALGGEVGPTTAYLIEAAPEDRRGLYGAMQYMTQDLAVMVAGLVGLALSRLLPPAAVDAYGWRIAFLLGAAIIPFGFVLRSRLVETLPEAGATLEEAGPVKGRVRLAAAGLALLAMGTVVGYTMDYMTTYASETLHMSSVSAFSATVAVGLSAATGDVLSGLLSDRFGRKPVMMIGTGLLLVLTLPTFAILAHYRTPGLLLCASVLLAGLMGIGTTPFVTWLAESLPVRVRSGSLALTYALAVSVFGGSCQFIAAWLTRVTGSPLAPAIYMSVMVVIGLAVMFAIPESAPRALRRAAARAAPLEAAVSA